MEGFLLLKMTMVAGTSSQWNCFVHIQIDDQKMRTFRTPQHLKYAMFHPLVRSQKMTIYATFCNAQRNVRLT